MDEPDFEEFDDYGLRPPPALPPRETTQSGNYDEVKILQRENSVPKSLCGPWYHTSYESIETLDNHHEDWTWFTRSPKGGTIWGINVLVAYVVNAPVNSKTHATSNRGDIGGYESNDALPDWWLSVGREDISKLMIVRTFKNNQKDQPCLPVSESEYHEFIRKLSIEKLKR